MTPVIITKIVKNDGSSIEVDNTSGHTGVPTVILNGDDLPSGGGTSSGVSTVNGQSGDVILDYSKLVRGSSNVLGPITVTNTLETILSSNIPMGDSRLFLTGTISRTGGSAAVGTLDVELYNGTTLLVGGTFEVFRDLNTVKQIVAPNSIILGVDTTLTLKMKYTGTGTVTVSNGTLSWDTIN